LVKSPGGPFDDLIQSVEGIDIIPEHNTLADLSDHLNREQQKATDLGDSYNIYAQLRRVLDEADVPDRYDVLICDPPATESDHLYNAIYATRNLLIPVEPSWKGQASIDGWNRWRPTLQMNLTLMLVCLELYHWATKDTIDQREMIENVPFSIPEVMENVQP